MIQGRMIWITAALTVLAVTGVGQKALAYTAGACQQDADKLCPGLTGKEVTPCLKQHEAELSTACKVNLAEAREMVRQAKDACEPDIKKYCADVQQGQGRIRRCLKAHEPDLTSGCKAQIAATRKKYNIEESTSAPAAAPPAAK